MNYFFTKCSDAVKHATKTESFGAFYSNEKNPTRAVHVHECCEIFLCIEGGSHFLVDNRVYDANDGDLFVVNQFEAHKVVAGRGEKFSRYILHVHPSFLYSSSFGDFNPANCFYSPNKATRVSLSQQEREHMVALFEELRTDFPYADDAYKRLRALEIILAACAHLSRGHGASAENAMPKSLSVAIEYINENYSKDLTVETVARSAFVSPAQLSRLFKRYCGTTPTRYVIGKRITEAKKMLSEGKSVTETAFMCGFNDYANFIRAFKSAVGTPPGKYKVSGR